MKTPHKHPLGIPALLDAGVIITLLAFAAGLPETIFNWM